MRHAAVARLPGLRAYLWRSGEFLSGVRDAGGFPRRRRGSADAIVACSSSPRDGASEHAERRQLTVLFCDVIGSTEMSAQLDPEDLRVVIGAYHQCVADTVEQFDGFVARFMGDGALVYFGFPRSHEDNAERAVRAALALVSAVRR